MSHITPPEALVSGAGIVIPCPQTANGGAGVFIPCPQTANHFSSSVGMETQLFPSSIEVIFCYTFVFFSTC